MAAIRVVLGRRGKRKHFIGADDIRTTSPRDTSMTHLSSKLIARRKFVQISSRQEVSLCTDGLIISGLRGASAVASLFSRARENVYLSS